MTRVMLIDDEQIWLKEYKRALEYEKYEIISLKNPDEVYTYYQNKLNPKPDIIILDIMMNSKRYKNDDGFSQGMRTGILFYPKLKEFFPDVPILVLTNVADPEKRNDIIQTTGNEKLFMKIDTTPTNLINIIKGELKG
ncbi:MAG: response regulator [Candidatus Omnitrophota bacterium]